MSLERIIECPHCKNKTLHEIPDSQTSEGYSYCSTDNCDWHDFCDCVFCELAFHDCYENIIEEDDWDEKHQYCSVCEKEL